MTKRSWSTLATLTVIALVQFVHAAEPGASPPTDPRRSGFDYMGAPTRAMQRDDQQNPGILWVLDGEALWNRNQGKADRSCASCHGAASQTMRGVATRYPAFDNLSQGPVNLGERINLCRVNHQQVSKLSSQNPILLSLEAYVAHQSRDLPITPASDNRLTPFRERGEKLFYQRLGQLNLSCAQCHDQLAGQRLGSSPIPQAHPTGYPIYRLEWQGMGSLQRRLRSCMNGTRAEPFPYGAQELVELELYLAARASGMRWEAPAVRP